MVHRWCNQVRLRLTRCYSSATSCSLPWTIILEGSRFSRFALALVVFTSLQLIVVCHVSSPLQVIDLSSFVFVSGVGAAVQLTVVWHAPKSRQITKVVYGKCQHHWRLSRVGFRLCGSFVATFPMQLDYRQLGTIKWVITVLLRRYGRYRRGSFCTFGTFRFFRYRLPRAWGLIGGVFIRHHQRLETLLLCVSSSPLFYIITDGSAVVYWHYSHIHVVCEIFVIVWPIETSS